MQSSEVSLPSPSLLQFLPGIMPVLLRSSNAVTAVPVLTKSSAGNRMSCNTQTLLSLTCLGSCLACHQVHHGLQLTRVMLSLPVVAEIGRNICVPSMLGS